MITIGPENKLEDSGSTPSTRINRTERDSSPEREGQRVAMEETTVKTSENELINNHK